MSIRGVASVAAIIAVCGFLSLCAPVCRAQGSSTTWPAEDPIAGIWILVRSDGKEIEPRPFHADTQPAKPGPIDHLRASPVAIFVAGQAMFFKEGGHVSEAGTYMAKPGSPGEFDMTIFSSGGDKETSSGIYQLSPDRTRLTISAAASTTDSAPTRATSLDPGSGHRVLEMQRARCTEGGAAGNPAELQKLEQLHAQGVLTDDEFHRAAQKVGGQQLTASGREGVVAGVWRMIQEDKEKMEPTQPAPTDKPGPVSDVRRNLVIVLAAGQGAMMRHGSLEQPADYRIDDSASPPTLELISDAGGGDREAEIGIYKLSPARDQLTIAGASGRNSPRPTDFEPGSGRSIMVLERMNLAGADSGSGSSLADKLKKLADLHAQGILNDEDYARAKARLLGQ